MALTSLPPIPLTLLDALNTLLRAVGLSEVVSILDTDSNVDSSNAFNALTRANGLVQSEGWNCNTEAFTLTPDVNSQIAIPPNWLRFRPARKTATWWDGKRFTRRGGLVYDLVNHTNILDPATKFDFEVVQSLAFEDLPEALRWYVTCTAGRNFAEGTYPSTGSYRFTEDEETRARGRALQEDQQLRDETLPESSPHFRKMRRR